MQVHEIEIEWGIWHGYYHSSYLPELDFSGSVSVEEGTLLEARQVEFDISGAFDLTETLRPLEGGAYTSVLRNQLGGLRLRIQGGPGTRVRIDAAIDTFSFTLGELYGRGHVVQYTGPKYSMAVFHAQPRHADWYLAPLRGGERALNPEQFGRQREKAFFISGFPLHPGQSAAAAWVMEPPAPGLDHTAEAQIRLILCTAEQDGLKIARGVPDFALLVNGEPVFRNAHCCMYHESAAFLEIITAEIPPSAFRTGENTVEVLNHDRRFSLFIQQVRLRQASHPMLEISACPKWAVCGRPFAVSLRAARHAVKIEITADDELVARTLVGSAKETFPLKQDCGTLMNIDFAVNEEAERALPKGIHDFYFEAKKPCGNLTIRFTDVWTGETAEAVIPKVFDVWEEKPAPMAGVELRTGSPGDYLPFLRWVRDRQIGNEVVFRDYHNDSGNEAALWDAAAFCRRNRMFVDTIVMNRQSTVADAAGDFCVAAGTHEHTGIFYGRDAILDTCRDLREAEALAVHELSLVADSYRLPGVPVGIGDATGGSRYAYLAGFDVIRHETFVGHHALLLPNARGCSRAFGKPLWGVHVASIHNAQPELEGGMRRFFLGLYLPWAMGASFAFEEDSLYQNYKYIKMAGNDYYTGEKQRITAEFYRHITLRGRRGTPEVPVAVLQGRHAPPMNGISTANNYFLEKPAPERDHYPVFGHTGRNAWEWGFRQPEKGFHLLQSFAPGVFLSPLYQQPEKTRRFFSGSPNGEFDLLPCEADSGVYGLYGLMLLLCWHTMTGEDCAKLLDYVQNGGTLFLSVPQLTTRADRDFLCNMPESDLELFESKELEELLGARVTGRSEFVFSGGAAAANGFALGKSKTQSCRRPNRDAEEDGVCYLARAELCGAECVLTDAAGNPLLLRNRCGQGTVYLLCTWAYPGHEALAELMPDLVQTLTDLHANPRVRVSADEDVYVSVWNIEKGHRTAYLLNTDWVTPGNRKPADVTAGGITFPTAAQEGKVTEIAVFPGGMMEWDGDYSVQYDHAEGGWSVYRVCGFGEGAVTVLTGRPAEAKLNGAAYRIGEGVLTKLPLGGGDKAVFGELRIRT